MILTEIALSLSIILNLIDIFTVSVPVYYHKVKSLFSVFL